MNDKKVIWKRKPLIKNRLLRIGLILLISTYLLSVFLTTEIDWQRILEGIPRGKIFIFAFFPPDFITRSDEILAGIFESLWMTIVATIVGILISIPVSLGAAKNIAPKFVYFLSRGVITLSRSFQEVILAIFFVKLMGFGPFAGMVTLSLSTIGFFAKLLSEDIEEINKSQAEAIKSTGSSWFQWVNYGVQPQVMPRFIGLSLYRLDINFRESAVIGIVGGGGIGSTLNTAFDRYEFETAAAVLIVIISIVMIVEYTSSHLRKLIK